MNLLVKKFWPPVLVILASVLAISCEDPGKIGLIINEDNGVLKTAFKEITLPSNVVQFDPRRTTESLTIKAGQHYSVDFGRVFAQSYTQFNPTLFVQPNTNSAYAGFEMIVGFTGLTGPPPRNLEEQILAIYQLAEDIDTTRAYTRVDELTLGTKLADWNFAPVVNDTLQLDSTYVVSLDDAIGQDLFDKLKAADPMFEDAVLFNQYFKGIGILATTKSRDIFELDRAKLKLTLKYNEFNSDGNPIERTYDFSIGSHGFYNIGSDVSGTALSGISPDNTDFYPSDDKRHIQLGTMIALRTDLQPFFDLSDTIEYMVINKAEIVIGGVWEGTEYDSPTDILQVYFTDESNEWPVIDDIGRVDSTTVGSHYITLQDESIGIPPGYYGFTQDNPLDTESFKYRINMSFFLQNLYAGKYHSVTEPYLEEKGQIYIFGESDVLYPTRSNSHTQTTGVVFHKDSIKLRIHYSYPRIQQTE